ncbi:spore coat protein CotJB [Haloplasma contractile]|uniref:Spore coat peptide assembly protein cotJB n=1 Tax=Haloplasma contractile SSD-17B TaxID=1033810 RepID=U2FI52_9MOLU|nr:spore coat protein CotJB [Haloplasma contractile]ERJ12490.1 Spore coat peptide assembly protein cotJB [Haloplasma contractile SSD-17B]
MNNYNYMNNNNMLSKEDLMKRITELSFYAVDLNLFLDNHPDSQQALQDYRIISQNLRQLEDIYAKNYGPLYNFGASGQFNNWTWIEEPWPWENK